MKLIYFPFLVFLIILSNITSIAQDIPIGTWRDHLPYLKGIDVAEGDGKIYCATSYSMFEFDLQEYTVTKMNKITGLSDIGIAAIEYSESTGTLLIGYANSNIDIIKDGGVINISDIIRSNAVAPGEKTISKIVLNNNFAYICCGFGIVKFDIVSREIKDTYYIGPDGSHLGVNDIIFNDTSVIAATDEGIYYADIDNPNLAYYENWTKDIRLPDPDGNYSLIEGTFNKIITSKFSEEFANDTILFFDGNSWNYSDQFETNDVYAIETMDDMLVVVYSYGIKMLNSNLELLPDNTIWTYNPGAVNPRDMIKGNDGTRWIADNVYGLVRMNGGYDFTKIYPNGPEYTDVFSMAAGGNSLWAVPGGINQSWNNLFKAGSIISFTDGTWDTYDNIDFPEFDSVRDMLCIAIDPFNSNKVYAGSWYAGILEFINGELTTFYKPENSTLQYNLLQGPPFVQVGGLAFDANGYLWATNSTTENCLSVRLPGNSGNWEWKSFYLGSSTSGAELGKLLIDSGGRKYIIMRADHSLLVFDDKNTVNDVSDDEVRIISSTEGYGHLPGNKIHSFAEDSNGEIWIGSDEGIGVIYSPENIFGGGNYDAQRILIPRNDGSGLADILFEFETITAIAVDDSNKKWIGTENNGVFYISADGLNEIFHFTSENSPLLSNTITSIAINRLTGEVFFGTSKGIISFKGYSTKPSESNEDVYAYPNPVKPGYEGPIAIKGLVKDADVKITDITGTLVYATRAEGGQAIWEGRNFEGSRVKTGVYLVFISNDDGSQSIVTKILFIE